MIRKPGHGVHWSMCIEERSSQFSMTPRIMFCQNLQMVTNIKQISKILNVQVDIQPFQLADLPI